MREIIIYSHIIKSDDYVLYGKKNYKNSVHISASRFECCVYPYIKLFNSEFLLKKIISIMKILFLGFCIYVTLHIENVSSHPKVPKKVKKYVLLDQSESK